MENTCDTPDYRLREEELRIFSEEGWLGYDTLEDTNQVRVVMVKVDGKLYNFNDKIEIEESIRKMLAEANLKDNIERLYKQINVELNPKL